MGLHAKTQTSTAHKAVCWRGSLNILVCLWLADVCFSVLPCGPASICISGSWHWSSWPSLRQNFPFSEPSASKSECGAWQAGQPALVRWPSLWQQGALQTSPSASCHLWQSMLVCGCHGSCHLLITQTGVHVSHFLSPGNQQIHLPLTHAGPQMPGQGSHARTRSRSLSERPGREPMPQLRSTRASWRQAAAGAPQARAHGYLPPPPRQLPNENVMASPASRVVRQEHRPSESVLAGGEHGWNTMSSGSFKRAGEERLPPQGSAGGLPQTQGSPQGSSVGCLPTGL